VIQPVLHDFYIGAQLYPPIIAPPSQTYVAWTFLSWYKQGYLQWRGGMRFKFFPQVLAKTPELSGGGSITVGATGAISSRSILLPNAPMSSAPVGGWQTCSRSPATAVGVSYPAGASALAWASQQVSWTPLLEVCGNAGTVGGMDTGVGSGVASLSNNECLEVEVPYATPIKYSIGCSVNDSNPLLFDLVHYRVVANTGYFEDANLPDSTNVLNLYLRTYGITVNLYAAGAEDTNLSFFMGAPRLYWVNPASRT